MRSSSAASGSAPGCENTTTFSRKIISVGIDWMPNAPASSCWASVSTLANTRSECVAAAFSNTGANWRHGPHQDAQKSTKHGVVAP